MPGSDLFLDEPAADGPASAATALRERLVRPRFDLFEADHSREPSARRDRQLVMNLFPDVVFTAVLDRVTIESLESFVWLGHFEGPVPGTVTIAVRSDVMSGEIRTSTALYEIRFVGNGTHVVRQVDPATFPPEMEPRRVSLDLLDLDRAPSQVLADDGSFIDVMIVYTPAARIGAGGTAAIESLIDLAIANTNTSYANSAVIQRVRLVHKTEIAYTEVDFDSDLTSLTNAADGVMDNVHALRNSYRADLVALVINNTALCASFTILMRRQARFRTHTVGVTTMAQSATSWRSLLLACRDARTSPTRR
jgi:peptidyl-Asp metalloendopeptidase